MNRRTKSSAQGIAAVFLLSCVFSVGLAQESLSSLQQQVLDDYKAMNTMTSEQRRAYRNNKFSGMDKASQKAYLKAYKSVRGLIPEYIGYQAKPNTNTTANKKTAANSKARRIPGTSIQYDTGVNVVSGLGQSSQMMANRYDSALNPAGTMCCVPVETSGTVTMATFSFAGTFFSSAVFSIYSNIMGTTANQVTSMGVMVNTGLNTLSIGGNGTANAYQNGTFLAGFWQFNPAQTAVAIDAGTTGGQGFHAITANDGAMASMITTLTNGGAGLNVILRLGGNLVSDPVPVELIDFTIEKGDD
ncbi:hypothetical protein [Marinicella sp. W31]|uniref:hypothetical protein n=1 Tax=Marinicella sp. W31 TaxID=3023713 RepID=UPI003756A27C